ncbi:HTH-type transcriptional repressor RspR [Paenibacillus solanacearum]|uniref:HTH-type transcriptional repressor RspR n=1 Tax=Paenibacillus solanacearum TaxID=2048548 RepID=A0A916K375_9BACL|nr:GntR family transcriptional regulator [Paenibacillus solanacearum]CAG7637161.1 HTH-type transcriptional repressor RspR [Paenibacillus solanacearum]
MTVMLESHKATKGLVRDYVHDTLLKNIMELTLEPGRFISEKEVAEMLQVSRSPIREAFVKLSQEELIETIPQKGSFITRIDLRLVEESRFIRETLEAAIVRQACELLNAEQLLRLQNLVALQELCVAEKNDKRLFELDVEFHQEMIVGCGKSRTWALLQQTATHYNRLRYLRLADNHDWDMIISQHHAIVQAIREKDPDQAESVMREHLTRVTVEKEELKAKYPTYFK